MLVMPGRAWILTGAAWLSLLAGLGFWLRTPSPGLREQLKTLQFWSLEICFVLVVCFGALVLRQVWRELHRGDALRMATLAAAAVALTVLVAPRTNRIYYDEQIYQSIGQNLSDLKLAQMCNDGTVEYGRLQCWSGEYNKQPYAYPHVLSVLYRVLGVSEWVAFGFNAIIIALTVCGVYLLTLLVFADRMAALFAGLILLLTPQQILWSATAAVEPSASAACVAALLCAAAFGRSGSTVALVATAVTTAYAVQFRPESFLIVPVVGLMLWRRLSNGELTRVRLWAVGLVALALVAVHIGHLAAVRSEGWGTREARLSLGYVLSNLRVNGWFYLADERFPVLFTVLALWGLFTRKFLAERVAFAVYFAIFFGVYLLFYAGSYNYGADVRYSLMTFPPIAVLGGLGLSSAVAAFESRRPGLRLVHVMVAALAFQFLWYAPLVRAITEEAWAARADVRFARSLAPELRGNAYVLTHNPGMFHVWGVSAGQMSRIVNNPGQLDFLAVRYRNVYLHWNFWCNVPDPVQGRFCLEAIKVKPAAIVRQHQERDQRYSLYRFEIPSRGR
jgi:hypothetical protein